MSHATSYMERALSVARQALGTTSPNPAVGALVVKDHTVLGEGFTLPPGQDHAEVVALKQAGEASRGASLYVTLEPCCNYGRTPPCTQAIIAAGISEVHVAAKDPNPRVNGRGAAELEAAGIRVYSGEQEEEAGELYEAFARHINTGMPFVTAKFAMSLDGKIATHTGDSKWVTGPKARALVQDMRRAADAVMVGSTTVLADDPQLTARDDTGAPLDRQPLRVVLDTRCRIPPGSKMFREPGRTLVFVSEEAPISDTARLTSAGAEVVPAELGNDGRVDAARVLAELGRRGVVNLLVEGGGTVLGSLFDAGLVDQIQAFVAPVIIGGAGAASPVQGQGVESMAQAWRLERASLEAVGEDWLITGYPVREG
jgi:diaminohydroxyphosphoribosylaminopyrimidine deaminase/5-amino-6-(5-phosphoribosylamino)uracil reductase